MRKYEIPQEGLKLIACITMLIDHIGSMFVSGYALRAIGRLSFPIYCFLIAEGAHYTNNPRKYALRMLLLAVISEIPFEMAFFNGFTPYRQNVMITLLLGFLALETMKKCPNTGLKVMAAIPFALAAEWSYADYGFHGVMLIALFALTRENPQKLLVQTLGMALLFYDMGGAALFMLGPVHVTLQSLGVLSMIPISLYSGKKLTKDRRVQAAFYLFYPVHLLVLWGIWLMLLN